MVPDQRSPLEESTVSYTRVLPRDLFNEAKLLKCYGQLALLIHDGSRWPLRFDHEDTIDPGFRIEQDYSDGSLWVLNLTLYCGKTVIPLASTYNSKQPYPLQFTTNQEETFPAFTDEGELSPQFSDYLDTLSKRKQP